MSDKTNASWPGWETVKLIGRGSFGAVYEIQREVFGDVEKAALKVISIPQNEGDIESLYGEGFDDESITNTFQNHLKSIVAEYSLMKKMSSCVNIVHCDDVRYVQHEDGIGWDIFIKMELLTPLTKALPAEITDDMVYKVAKDMCNALITCKELGVVHRDIKPQNIFQSPNGDYKLGDFGIAKTVEKTMGGTKIGTYKFMAPEVYNNRPYGMSADVYSLGLVLYWMLNKRRMPFMPLPPEKVNINQESETRYRRFSGEPLPAPATGSETLKKIVLKACAFDPKERYSSAAEMLQDLNGGFEVKAELRRKEAEELEEALEAERRREREEQERKRREHEEQKWRQRTYIEQEQTRKETGGQDSKRKVNWSMIVAACAVVALVISLVTGKKGSSPEAPTAPVQPAQQVQVEQTQQSQKPQPEPDVQSQATPPAETPKEPVTIQLPTIPQRETKPAKKPSVDDVKPFGEVITYPDPGTYLDSYETKYVKAPKGNSIYVFWNYNGGVSDSRRKFNLYEGDEVTVLARQGTRSCVIFKDKNGKEQIGWVNSDYLVSEY